MGESMSVTVRLTVHFGRTVNRTMNHGFFVLKTVTKKLLKTEPQLTVKKVKNRNRTVSQKIVKNCEKIVKSYIHISFRPFIYFLI